MAFTRIFITIPWYSPLWTLDTELCFPNFHVQKYDLVKMHILIQEVWYLPQFCISNKLPGEAGPGTAFSETWSWRICRRKPCSFSVLGIYWFLIWCGIWYRSTKVPKRLFQTHPSFYVLPLSFKILVVVTSRVVFVLMGSLVLQISCW